MSDANPVGLPNAKRPSARLRARANRWYLVSASLASLVLCCMFCVCTCEPGTVARRSQCKNNLKQIGLAMFNYHDAYGCFPPAYIADADGRPMHSWRVLLLPFLDEAARYRKYRFDEPWDGPNNSELATSVP